jgi:hypothetical protein
LSYFPSTLTSLGSSNKSSSSTIVVHALDGIITPTNLTSVSDDRQQFSGTYSETVAPGTNITTLGIGIVQQPPELLSTRIVDSGVLSPGDNVTVTLMFRNLSNTSTISHVVLNDNWWKSYGFFKLITGNSTIAVPTLEPGTVVSPSYTIQYTGTGSTEQQATIPPETATYIYSVLNTINGKSLNSSVMLYSSVNGAFLLLGQDVREPVLYTYLYTSMGIGGSVGSTQKLKLFVDNIGTRTASSVTVDGNNIGDLVEGASSTLPFSLTDQNLLNANLSRSYSVSYITPEGKNVTVGSNTVNLLFPHKLMSIGMATLGVNSTDTSLKGGGTNLTVTFTTSNRGAANLTSFVANTNLPSGLSCGKVLSKNLTCANGSVALKYANLKSGTSKTASISFNLSSTAPNYMIEPVPFVFNSSGFALAGMSNGDPIPTGVLLSKSFSPNVLFGGMLTYVSLRANNTGPFTVYNATVITGVDTFDTLPRGAPSTQVTNETIAPGKSLSFTYNVTASSVPGNLTGQIVGASFFFGGSKFTLTHASQSVVIYNPLSVTITTTPATPTEGKSFTVLLKIVNPSPVAVSDVNFTIPLPPEVKVISENNATFANGMIRILANQLRGNGVYLADLNVSASSGVTIPFAKASLGFAYSGQSIKGVLTQPPTQGIAINENVLTRYVLPTGAGIIVLLVVAFFVRRMAGTANTSTAATATSSSSQK